MPDDQNPVRGLHSMVVHRLGAAIAAGELAPDSQIVPEEVSERFGASRPVVREALRVLEAKGMVRPRPKTGTRVLPVESWNLLDRDVIGWRVLGGDRERQLAELADLRTAVEAVAARRCAEHVAESQVTALREACDAMQQATEDGDHSAFTRADIGFHSLLLDASGNSIFARFAEPFAAFLHAREDLETLPDHLHPSTVEDHRGIVEAIADGDGEEAERRIRELIAKAQAELAARLGD